MDSSAKRSLALFVYLCMSACTTLTSVPDWRTPVSPDAPSKSQSLKPGDQIRVTMTSSKRIKMRLTAVETDTLVGVTPKSSDVTHIPFDQVVNVERRKHSGLKTGLLVLGVLGVVVLMEYASATASVVSPGPP